MFTYEEAKRKVIDFINRDFNVPDDELVLLESSTLEKSYGWVFFWNSKRYLETRNIRFSVAGGGPVIFERSNGKMMMLGGALPSDKSIEEYERNYEKGFTLEPKNLSILKVRDQRVTVDLLHRLNMKYVTPEIEYGVEWRIPKTYTIREIKDHLSSLPCTFTKQIFWNKFDIFDQMNETKCCEYVLSEHSDVQGTRP
jgi:hypothetical protein